ncbi:ABC transporter substrate-binding protein [Candidimonas humi]|jgi:NitT/TauT family transport system substrate-binding protein|uniref:ABC transporter substrate-binding protein n=1 Tax=Candidimonas humi TaxID=683355 RepID=A0ABV8NY11_9BURK|nr:ABC transporter substrate-binding protein [Candidimonas humi]MBV6304289.1 ABC transporter substrate-binding protein [Candidimonas humi]
MKFTKLLGGMLVAGAIAGAPAIGHAEEITITKQPSILYLPALVMEKQGLIEKAAAAEGVKDLKVNWRSFSSGGASTDALLSGNVQIVNSGLGNLLLLWDRTHGKVKGITTNSALPLALVTRDPKIKSLKDYGPKDKIAVPTVRISTQAILLQMACEKVFGKDNWAKLDANTVQLGHPDAAAMLANPNGEITSHFGAPPFYNKEIKTIPNAHIILRSNDIIDGGLSQSTLFTTTKFADANPKIIKAVLTASAQAIDYIKAHTPEAVDIYRELSGDKTSQADLLAMLKQPGMMDFQLAPAGSMKFAAHMHKVGILKTMPKQWTDYFLPVSASLKGN